MEAIQFQNTTNFLSDRLFSEHCKLYEGYVNKINEVTDKLAKGGDRKDANATYSTYRALKKGETYALDGVLLHELYFRNIGGGGSPKPKTQQMITDWYGTLEDLKIDMTACGKAARGWAVLVYEQRSKRMRTILLDTHDEGNVVMAYPLLVLDMYEHAYALDYGIDKETYIKKFWDDIDWEIVERRFEMLKL